MTPIQTFGHDKKCRKAGRTTAVTVVAFKASRQARRQADNQTDRQRHTARGSSATGCCITKYLDQVVRGEKDVLAVGLFRFLAEHLDRSYQPHRLRRPGQPCTLVGDAKRVHAQYLCARGGRSRVEGRASGGGAGASVIKQVVVVVGGW